MMDMAELVRTIVQEVLERTEAARAKACVKVLAPREEALERRMAALISPFYAEGADMFFQGEGTGGRTPVRYVLPELSCSDMADLAAGKASSPLMEEVLGLLLSGIAVEVAEFSYRAFAETAPGPLYERYVAYEKVLAGYGLRAFRPWVPEKAMVREKLITAAMVEKAGVEGRRALVVPAGASITPLAAEKAEELHISIVKEG